MTTGVIVRRFTQTSENLDQDEISTNGIPIPEGPIHLSELDGENLLPKKSGDLSIRAWFEKLRGTFGMSFLILVSIVYLVQGFGSFMSLAVSFLMKDTMHLQPGESQAILATAAFPWTIKPLFGVLSDSLPICGFRRKSYLVGINLLGCITTYCLHYVNSNTHPSMLTCLLLCTRLATAMSDVIIDALVVERARLDPQDGANDLQSLTWSMMSIGGVLGSLLAGPATSHWGPQTVFVLASIAPCFVVGLAWGMDEEKSQLSGGCTIHATEQIRLVLSTLRVPVIWKSVFFMFLSQACTPVFDQIQFYYSTEILHFSPEFLGNVAALGFLFLFIGTLVFNTWFKAVPFRRILLQSQICLSIVSITEVLLVTRVNLKLGISDKWFVLLESMFSEVVARLIGMPILILCAKLCPRGIEGTFFALLMANMNLSYAVSSYWGALLAGMLGITSNSFDLLWIAIVIRSVLMLLPLGFLSMLPDYDPTNEVDAATSRSVTDDECHQVVIIQNKTLSTKEGVALKSYHKITTNTRTSRRHIMASDMIAHEGVGDDVPLCSIHIRKNGRRESAEDEFGMKHDGENNSEENENKINESIVEESNKNSNAIHKSYITQFFTWLRKIRDTFGLGFLLLVGTVYFVQGFNSFSSFALGFLIKDVMKLQPTQSQTVMTASAIPWSIKPFYGIMSDSLPIFGYRRKSYLIIMNLVGIAAFYGLYSVSGDSSISLLMVILVGSSMATAVSDVIIDALVVERARLDPKNGANDLQSLTWCMMSLGGILGSLLAGPATSHLGPNMVFLFAAAGPVTLFFLSCSMYEVKTTLSTSCLLTAREQVRLLIQALRVPVVWRAALFLFSATAISPMFAQIQFYYVTEELHFSEEFLGNMNALGFVFLMVGTITYNSFFKEVPFRTMFFYAHIGLAIVSLAEVVLVTRRNLQWGIPDKWFVIGDAIISDIIGRMKTMPLLVLCAKLCPKGIEGTFFALLMSISNLAWTVSSFWGAWLCTMLGIARNSYGNLWLAIVIRSGMKLLPLLFLCLLPTIDPQDEVDAMTTGSITDLEMDDPTEGESFLPERALPIVSPT